MKDDRARVKVKTPEILIYLKATALGLLLTEIFRISYAGGTAMSRAVTEWHPGYRLIPVVGLIALFTAYALYRGIAANATRLLRSSRYDLVAVFALGVWTSALLNPLSAKLHNQLAHLDAVIPALLTAFAAIVALSALVRGLSNRQKEAHYQLYFLVDDEIKQTSDDFLNRPGFRGGWLV